MFKAGDKMLCIYAGGSTHKTGLIYGKVYTLNRYSTDSDTEIYLCEINNNSWWVDRFVPACGLAKVLYGVDAGKGDNDV